MNKEKKVVLIHGQYRGYEWPGEGRTQGICKHVIDMNIPVPAQEELKGAIHGGKL